MTEASSHSSQLQHWLDRLGTGDPAATDGLLRHVARRLEGLTRQMLRDFPGVRRWAETDDVFQNAVVRLLRALQAVKPTSARGFFALATEQVRRELIDLARHYYGPHGTGANHASRPPVEEGERPAHEQADLSHEPSRLAEWCELHRQVAELPEEEREVVGLLFYQGLTQAEAAELLQVTVRTVQRRWQAALVRLHRTLKGHWPGS